MPSYLIPAQHELKKGNVFDLIPEEIGYFSDSAGNVTLTKENLHKYQIPNTNKSLQCPYGINAMIGYKNYKAKVYTNGESTIGNFLKSLVINEQTKFFKNLKLDEINVFCPSSFLQYITTLKTSEFYIIRINDRLIIANSETRAGQNIKMSYAGIRFEDILNHGTHYKTINNFNLFEKILKIKINNLNFLYFSEIDSLHPKLDNQTTEIKMILCKNNIPNSIMKNQQNILKMINKGNNYFDSFILRTLIQCIFANNLNLIIGVRDSAFNLRNICEYSVRQDLEKYCLNNLHYEYAIFTNATYNINNVMKKIKQCVTVQNPVYKLKINGDYTLTSVDEPEERAKIIETVMIPEFMEILLKL
jgi:hypothetical protein